MADRRDRLTEARPAAYDERVNYNPDTVNPVASILSSTSSIVAIVFYILYVIALWKVFTKADWPGILAIIPIVNVVIYVKIAGMSGWLALLFLVPIVNVVFAIVVAVKLGGAFGKGGVWSFFLLWLLSIIGVFILGFGSARYTKRA